ncbi:hypothetical protein [Lysobacter sp. A378]
MRLLPPVTLLATLVIAGCSGVEYRDTNAAVDARPECSGADEGRPGEGVPAWCERSQEAVWSSDSEPAGIDFSAGDDDRR